MTTSTISKKAFLHQLAAEYVTKGLGAKNFDAIPYHDDVELRAPLLPGGSEVPIKGKENLRTLWWAPLPTLVGQTTVVETYVSKDDNSVAVEFYCEIIKPACTLRVIDRFKVDEDGKIVSQENFFDPRPVTDAGKV